MADPDKLRALLAGYLNNQSAIEAVVAMYGAIDSTTAVLNGDLSEKRRIGVGQMLVNLTMGLQTNPFYIQFASQMTPVFQMAVNAYLDHLEYFDKDQQAYPSMSNEENIKLRSRLLTCHYVKHEIALAALLCEQGAGTLREKSVTLRDALIELEEAE